MTDMRLEVLEPPPEARELTQRTLTYNALFYASEQLDLLLRNIEHESGRSYVGGAASHEQFAKLIKKTLGHYQDAIPLARVPKPQLEIEKCLKVIEQVVLELSTHVIAPLGKAKLKNDRSAKQAISAAVPHVRRTLAIVRKSLDKNRGALVA